MTTRSLITSPDSLDEDYRQEDLLGYSKHVESLQIKLDSLKNKSLLGLVGEYGTGKSLTVKLLQDELSESVKWLEFQAWKYPDRNNLWEGFVLDFVKKFAPDEFKSILKKFDGTKGDDAKQLVKTVGAGANVIGNMFTLGAGTAANQLIDKLAIFANTSPAHRVFQIQDIFKTVLNKKLKVPRTIYIVIEDADRSGISGIYFIETLSNFLKTLNTKHTIKVLVLVSRKSFDHYEYRDAYVKALDAVEFFSPALSSMQTFVDNIFTDDVLSLPESSHQLSELFQRLQHGKDITIREIKFIIRNSELRYHILQRRGFNPDPRIVILLESLRFTNSKNTEEPNDYDTLVQSGVVSISSPIYLLLISIIYKLKVEFLVDMMQEYQDSPAPYRRDIQFVDDLKFRVSTKLEETDIPRQIENSYCMPYYYLY